MILTVSDTGTTPKNSARKENVGIGKTRNVPSHDGRRIFVSGIWKKNTGRPHNIALENGQRTIRNRLLEIDELEQVVAEHENLMQLEVLRRRILRNSMPRKMGVVSTVTSNSSRNITLTTFNRFRAAEQTIGQTFNYYVSRVISPSIAAIHLFTPNHSAYSYSIAAVAP